VTTPKVTLILDSADITNKPFRYGRVRIVPSTRIPDPADSGLLEMAGAEVRFDKIGTPQVDLFPNDLIGPQGDTLPGWYYTIYYDECPGTPRPWSFYVLSTNNTPQRLSSLAATPVVQPGTMVMPRPAGIPTANQVPKAIGDGSQNSVWGNESGSGSGTVTGMSIASANGFAGTVASASTTPTVTLEVTAAGILKSDGTAVSAATAGTDYATPTQVTNAITTAETYAANAASAAVTTATTAAASAAASAIATALTTAEIFATNAVGTGNAATASNLAGDTAFPDRVSPKVRTLTDGSSVALDASLGNVYRWPLGGASHTLAAPSNPVDGDVFVLRIIYGGAYTPLFNAIFKFGTAGPPAWTSITGKVDEVGFAYNADANGGAGGWIYRGPALGF